jgi:hypothetical protein
MAAEMGGVLYVAGGYYDATNQFAPQSFQQTLYALDTNAATPTWEVLADVPVARGDGALVALGNGRLLLLAGETHARGARTEVRTRPTVLHARMPTAYPHGRVPYVAQARAACACSMYMSASVPCKCLPALLQMHACMLTRATAAMRSRRVRVCSHCLLTGSVPQVATHDVHMYYTKHNLWVPKAPIPEARFRFAAAVHAGVAYAFGGHQTCAENKDTSPCHSTAHSSTMAYYEADVEPMFVLVKA